MARVPKNVPRGVFQKGEEFRKMRSGVIQSYRKRIERDMRKLVSEQVKEVKDSISKIIVTGDGIQVFDQNNKIIFQS